MLEDETDLVQFGQIDSKDFISVHEGQQLDSSWVDDLIANPNGKYKFASVHLQVHRQINKIIRKGYGLLDLIGDVGGFVDALYYLFALLFSPYWSFRYQREILTKLFR